MAREKPKKGDKRISGNWRQVWNGKKWVSTRRVDPDQTSGPTVVGPYDSPFLTPRQQAREARRRALEAVETPETLRKRAEREREGAKVISESFEDMLSRQAAQNLAAQNAILAATGGAGAALTTGAVTGATQSQAAVPLLAAGENVRLQRDIEQRAADALAKRNQDFRQYLAKFGQDIRMEEREKQAAQIERAAAAKAYDIDVAKLGIQQASEAQRQANWEADYALRASREERLSRNDTGDIDDLLPTIQGIAEESSVAPGAGNWVGQVYFIDPETDERTSITLPPEGVKTPFDPKTTPKAKRQKFWQEYVANAIGAQPYDIVNVSTASLTRGPGKRDPVKVGQELLTYLENLGYTRQEAYRAILRTTWGGINARALRTALGR